MTHPPSNAAADPIQHLSDFARRIDQPPAWQWNGFRIAHAEGLLLARRRKGAVRLGGVPEARGPMAQMLAVWLDATPRISVTVSALRAWAGPSVPLWRDAPEDDPYEAAEDGSFWERTTRAPGWFGGQLFDRRYVALALDLVRRERKVTVARSVPGFATIADGLDPIVIRRADWMAVIMPMLARPKDADAPRFNEALLEGLS